MDNNHLIGTNNQLPWHLPADLKHFKEITMHKPIVMGRKTFESIGKALPHRENIIITRNIDYTPPDNTLVFYDIESVIQYAKHQHYPELMIIGGEEIFRKFLDLNIINKLYLTIVQHKFEGDVFFPKIDLESDKWQEISRQTYAADEKNAFDLLFLELKKSIVFH